MQNERTVWLRVMTVAVAIFAIVVAALPMSPDVDSHAPFSESTAALAGDAAVAGDTAAQPEPGTQCLAGLACLLAIVPSSDLAFVRLVEAAERPIAARHTTSGANYLHFHPPRILSRV